MPGGLLNLITYGNQNVVLNGNPSKTYFKCTYAKHTNFGLQKFRVDFNGLRNLKMSTSSTFKFKIPRNGDLLMNNYLVVTLPTIWSPIFKDTAGKFRAYEFKWIKQLGTQMIKRIRFTVGGLVIQEYTGNYLHNVIERDFDSNKKRLFDRMTGNIAELNDPANSGNRTNQYPSVFPLNQTGITNTHVTTYNTFGPEPSIRSRKLYIPLNSWFSLGAKMAIPLTCLYYNLLNIEIEMRPVDELFVVRDVNNVASTKVLGDYIKPNFADENYLFYRFLQPPKDNTFTYTDKRTDWAADVHLLCTYAFLTEDELRVFTSKPQQYLIKDPFEYTFKNITSTKSISLKNSKGLVSSWMWYFQRSDVYKRNEWTNYTNWSYDSIPYDVVSTEIDLSNNLYPHPGVGIDDNLYSDLSSCLLVSSLSPLFKVENEKKIMQSWSLVFDGKYRENQQDEGVLNLVEKYTASYGNAKDGLYCYNFGLYTNPYDHQPSGAINLSKVKNIDFEISTLDPPLDNQVEVNVICNSVGDTVGIQKPNWSIFKYNYDLTIQEERYNVVTFSAGNVSILFSK